VEDGQEVPCSAAAAVPVGRGALAFASLERSSNKEASGTGVAAGAERMAANDVDELAGLPGLGCGPRATADALSLWIVNYDKLARRRRARAAEAGLVVCEPGLRVVSDL
jgi:hypothetical protein